MNIQPLDNVSIIVAIAKNNAIGLNNQLLYRLPNDLKRFKQLTTGHTIIMGRKTFESLPKGALPNRRNIVLSRQEGLHYENAECYRSIEEALMQCDYTEDVYIIGGGELYRQTIGLAKRIHLTVVDDIPTEADAFFPELKAEEWREVLREEHPADEKHAQAYTFIDLMRR
ncbi:MAG: dihydrofolate reductase [Bacteroidaceae bacterium]|nr:dihydrofolate reductase [Bacteroidaceae bacterium]MBR5847316.1 dihydrofolate reductase [Bacteroidaceae bacterium]